MGMLGHVSLGLTPFLGTRGLWGRYQLYTGFKSSKLRLPPVQEERNQLVKIMTRSCLHACLRSGLQPVLMAGVGKRWEMDPMSIPTTLS